MKYLIGAVFGAVLAVLPGIPAFTTWTTATPENPFLFDLYCYDPNLAGVSRFGRSEGARWWGVSTTSAVGAPG